MKVQSKGFSASIREDGNVSVWSVPWDGITFPIDQLPVMIEVLRSLQRIAMREKWAEEDAARAERQDCDR